MRTWKTMSGSLRLALVAGLIAVLALVAVLTSQRLLQTGSDAPRPSDHGTAGASDTASDAKPAAKLLTLGTAAKISPDYRVTVTDVTVHEGATQQFLVATIKADYIGKDEGDLWADLNVEFGRPGTKRIGESGCPIDLGEKSPSDQPSMAPGDSQTYATCIDLPSKEVDGGWVSVEEAYAKGHPAFWSTEGAAATAIPSAAPTPTAAPSAAYQAPTVRQHANSDGSGQYDSDDVEKYRRKLDDAIDKYEEQRDNIKAQLRAWKDAGYHGDAVGDYEDWLDDVEKAIETYKKQREQLGG